MCKQCFRKSLCGYEMSMLKPNRWWQRSTESQKLRCFPQVWHWLILCLRQVPKAHTFNNDTWSLTHSNSSLKTPDLHLPATWTIVETGIASWGWREAHLDFFRLFPCSWGTLLHKMSMLSWNNWDIGNHVGLPNPIWGSTNHLQIWDGQLELYHP